MEQSGLQINANLLLNGQYAAALYLRFSKDDGRACDSSSIETQRMTLERYCQENGYNVYDAYVDDGTNTNSLL